MKNSVPETTHFRDEVITALSTIKEECDEHLLAINENTNEIQSNYEFLCELDAKIEKLIERIDRIQLMLEGKAEEQKYDVLPLNQQEQQIFAVLLRAPATLTYHDISMQTGLPLAVVKSYTSNLIAKGVPLLKKYVHTEIFLYLDQGFKQTQAAHSLAR